MSVAVFLGLAALFTFLDWRWRAIPRVLPIVGAVLAGFLVPFSPLGAALGVLAGVLADLPSGDLGYGGMLGAWLGVEGTIVVWTAALISAHVVWMLWEDGIIRAWPGDWPFIPFLTVPACAIVLGQGGW